MSFVAFFVLAALAVGSAAGLLLRRNPIHGALFLAINLATIAALLTAGLFEYNFGDSEVLMLFLIIVSLPAAAARAAAA